MNIILSYFEKNYKAVSEKLNVLIDEEMGGVECGYTKKFEFGIDFNDPTLNIKLPRVKIKISKKIYV